MIASMAALLLLIGFFAVLLYSQNHIEESTKNIEQCVQQTEQIGAKYTKNQEYDTWLIDKQMKEINTCTEQLYATLPKRKNCIGRPDCTDAPSDCRKLAIEFREAYDLQKADGYKCNAESGEWLISRSIINKQLGYNDTHPDDNIRYINNWGEPKKYPEGFPEYEENK